MSCVTKDSCQSSLRHDVVKEQIMSDLTICLKVASTASFVGVIHTQMGDLSALRWEMNWQKCGISNKIWLKSFIVIFRRDGKWIWEMNSSRYS